MRKVLVVLGILGLGMFVRGLLEKEVPVAQAGPAPECAPLLVTGGAVIQDMNGDGVLEPIAEALRLLHWAFLGTPAPIAPCASDSFSGLPDSGQTQCYDEAGNELDRHQCFMNNCRGQDVWYQSGCPKEGRFTDNGDGTVTDHCTGTQWQKGTADVNGDGTAAIEDVLSWCEALTYCDNLLLAGHDDWRLPNVRELQSIADYGRVNPAMDPVFDAVLSFYWSSTSFFGQPDAAWYVLFVDGFVNPNNKVRHFFVRAVRGGQGQAPECAPLLVTGGGAVIQDMNGDGVFEPIAEALTLLHWAFLGTPAPIAPCASGSPSGLPDSGQTQCYDETGFELDRHQCFMNSCRGQDVWYQSGCPKEGRFTDNGDGTVTDHCTGTQWQKGTADMNGDGTATIEDALSWCEALTYCDNLLLAGHDDWRLPNVRELQSITDYGRDDPAMDPVFDAVSDYWSSTSFLRDPRAAWVCVDGSVHSRSKVSHSFVRAVRGGS